MSQRNVNNPRNQGEGPVGHSRKSAGRAKPAKKAASSVTVTKAKASSKSAQGKLDKANSELKQSKEERKKVAEQQRTMTALAGEALRVRPDYLKWRRRWLACVIIAVVGVLGSVGCNWFFTKVYGNDGLLVIHAYIIYGLLIAGYLFIMAALFIDFVKVRGMRDEEVAKLGAAGMSKKQRKHYEAEMAARAEAAAAKKKK